jgi:hypothetical protein
MNSQGIKIGIISGIVSSLIVIIFIQPILGFTWNVIIGISSQVHHGYVDRIYRNAAVGDRNVIGHLTALYLFMSLPLAGTVFLLRAKVSVPPKLTAVNRSLDAILISTCVVTVILMLAAFALSVGIMEISSSFNQRLTVLAPAISDAEYKTFRARWANMRSEADYNAIVANMEARAKELGVTLPKLRTP